MATETLNRSDDKHGEDWSGGVAPMKASYGKLMMWYFLLSDAFTFSGFLIAYGALRMSSPTWPLPDFVFSTFPGMGHTPAPLMFVTLMTFILIISSVTMVRGVQEGHRENQKGAVNWLLLTALGGLMFLGCQAWEWTKLIKDEHVTIHNNPFGTYTEDGEYVDSHGNATYEMDHGVYKLDADGNKIKEKAFTKGMTYLIHWDNANDDYDYRSYKVTSGDNAGQIRKQELGPQAFGALFFGITGFHGFHVFTGVVFLLIIAINAKSGLYVERKNGYEMVEKIGLYWHFVDLVWVFVFLVFYLL